MNAPALGASDRALVESHVVSSAQLLDRILAALLRQDPAAHAALMRRLRDGEIFPSITVALMPDGGATVGCELLHSDGRLDVLLQLDLPVTGAAAACGSIQ